MVLLHGGGGGGGGEEQQQQQHPADIEITSGATTIPCFPLPAWSSGIKRGGVVTAAVGVDSTPSVKLPGRYAMQKGFSVMASIAGNKPEILDRRA
jgi:hypothetical protein